MVDKDFNPTERKTELARKKKIDAALKALEEASYLNEDEWDRLRAIYMKALSRDFMRWLQEREYV